MVCVNIRDSTAESTVMPETCCESSNDTMPCACTWHLKQLSFIAELRIGACQFRPDWMCALTSGIIGSSATTIVLPRLMRVWHCTSGREIGTCEGTAVIAADANGAILIVCVPATSVVSASPGVTVTV